jgi:hypothetical protein
MMRKDKRFALLVGKAFLQELEAGHTDSAIAFGRAFLLSLGYKGVSGEDTYPALNGKDRGEATATVAN